MAGGVALRYTSARTDEPTSVADQPTEDASELDQQLQDRLKQLQAEADDCREEADSLLLQLRQVQAEADDCREEADSLLLQLHQVQEELEHYFLLSRDLQRQLEAGGAQPPEAVGQLTALKHRFGEVIHRQQRRQSRLEALVLKQNSALTRASRMLQRTPAKAPVPPIASRVHEEIAFL